MGPFVAQRLLDTISVLLGVSFITFALLFLTGDPTYMLVPENYSREQIAEFRHRAGLDRPWYVQYGAFLRRAVTGDFGTSLRSQLPALPLVLERLPATVELACAAMALSLGVTVPVGILAATRRRSLIDTASMAAGLLGQSAPTFWIGLVLILVFGVHLRWLPISGRGGLLHLVLPTVTLALYTMGRNTRVVRAAILDVLGQEFIRTAHAKGLPSRRILLRHILRNALLPIVTLVGLDFGVLLGGAIVTETVFAWPGIGRLVVNAVYQRDFPVVETAVIVIAAMFVALNFCIDLLYGYLDPRIRRA
ncbi:MAG: ABC transporter permease [Candidatus Rokuibacteriota bacterium]|nr:MAG: ABC transporter permease [Candidatus Rokubacteria bacterium]